MSKYGLPKGYRLIWSKGVKLTGLMRVTETRTSWELVLRAPEGKPDYQVMSVEREGRGLQGAFKVRLRIKGRPMVLKQRADSEDEAKALGDAWTVLNPHIWQQYLPKEEN